MTRVDRPVVVDGHDPVAVVGDKLKRLVDGVEQIRRAAPVVPADIQAVEVHLGAGAADIQDGQVVVGRVVPMPTQPSVLVTLIRFWKPV